MVRVGMLSFAHVHANGYAKQVLENEKTELTGAFMAEPILMPRLTIDMEKGTVLEWHKEEGATVERGEIVAVVFGDKVEWEVEAGQPRVGGQQRQDAFIEDHLPPQRHGP